MGVGGILCIIGIFAAFAYLVIRILMSVGDTNTTNSDGSQGLQKYVSKDYVPEIVIERLISADYKRRKWRIEGDKQISVLYGFEEISGFELIINDKTISYANTETKGGVARAVVGGIVGGGVGALVGAGTAKSKTTIEHHDVVTKRSVRVSLTNPSVNMIEINIPLKDYNKFFSTETDEFINILTADNVMRKVTSERAGYEVVSLLESIISVAEKEANQSSDTDKYEEVRKLKQLYDDGIITNEEFEKKKM